ncbi:hypothetical protein GCM10025857_06640 [Alicyclobacillus contaminans]|uniref:hypothetical protein n=1 Tax=Alicyclobacillus contaminans TaxID=392016 RepID=UPI000416D864|nr:hypothetical protein [Alicyclobacillus contaminans]GMA49307.1 hypothetical protein GCM10025857_06640 [Alicyclobacillus contaminans]
MTKKDKPIRLIDVLNFAWATLHDFLYLGVAAGVYWLFRQPPAVRTNALIIGVIVTVWLVGEVINFRWHRQMDKRLQALERRLERR